MSEPFQMPQPEEVIHINPNPNKNSDTEEVIHLNTNPNKNSDTCEIRSENIKNGHTFLVTTVQTETITTTTETLTQESQQLKAVPLLENPKTLIKQEMIEQPCCSSSCSSPEHSTKAIVPLSSSLPSKLLRFHAKKTPQALLKRMESQEHSIDSQFDSDEGMTAGFSGYSSNNGDLRSQDSCESLDNLEEPSAPPMSPPPPRNSPSADNLDEKIDVGMGSSIEGSEESEEDDELKPLAVDNHVLHDVDLRNSLTTTTLSSQTPITTSSLETVAEKPLNNTAVLSEANLEKFRKHQSTTQSHPIMDNIYLHPNFKYDFNTKEQSSDNALKSPDTTTTTPLGETKRIHRSFLTMKKSSEPVNEKANSVVSQATSASGDKTLVNEIDNLDPSLIPSDELAAEIAEAVEFYFSNESILKDAFLLKHVKRNKEGFVSLKLISSFKRVRQLTKDWKVVGNAVKRKSRKIELNDVGTKVRRQDPLPNFDETMPSRTIVACDLPLDKLSIEKVSDIFSKCGEIALIRILKPGMAIPVDVRQFMNKYPEMQQKECALVEYLESSSAREARNLQGPFRVYEMVAPKKKTGKKAVIQVSAPVVRMVENYRYYNDHSYERTRGGSFSGMPVQDMDLRYRLKRNNSDFAAKAYNNELPQTFNHSTAAPHYHHNSTTPYAPTHRGSFGSDHHQTQHQYHTHQNHHQTAHYQPRGSITHDITNQTPSSPGTNSNFFAYTPRRYSNTSTISANTANNNSLNNIDSALATKTAHMNMANNPNSSTNPHNLVRRLSNCSQEGYNEAVRRSSNCSENAPQRRDSNCSENCPCSRRISDFGQTENYRKTSQGSIGSNGERRFSNGSMQFERTFSNGSDISNNFHRRASNDFNFERKQSLETQAGTPYEDPNVGGGGGGYNVFPRRYSNNFNNSINSKLAAYDNAQYINGRRISTDSGYDRRFSFGSEYEGSPRSRTNSFLNNYKHGISDYDGQPRSRTGSFLDGSPRSRSGSFAQRTAEHLVRTPIGPDGSKGFGARARKLEQTISIV